MNRGIYAMRGHLIMSEKERLRKGILSKVEGKYIKLTEAAKQMRVSYRQAKRIWSKYKKKGDEGLIHGNRGNSAVGHGFSSDIKEAVLARYEERYEGFGPTLASEKLEKDGYIVGRETLRKWLLEKGLWKLRRKRKAHRRSRDRRECFGELLQMDGSIHPWFGKEYDNNCLLNLVDDATAKSVSLMAEGETTRVVMLVLKAWIERYGIPQSIYVDLKTVYIGPKELSVFERACKRLGIEIIKAYSAQAKGRVERNHAVYQDRFVKELKLEGIKTVEGANCLLTGGFVDELNEKFAKEPLSKQDAHAPLLDVDLDQILVWNYKRQIQNDWTILFKGKRYQIFDEKKKLRAKQNVDVKIHLEGEISISFKGFRFKYKVLEKAKKMCKLVQKKGYSEYKKRVAGYKGKLSSPWNKFNPNWLKKAKKDIGEMARR